MNETFDINRFGGIIARYWAEKKKQQLIYWLVAVLFLVGISYWYHSVEYANKLIVAEQLKQGKNQTDMMINRSMSALNLFALIIGAVVFSLMQISLTFDEMTGKRKGRFFMQIPALKVEKFLFLLLSALVVPFLFFWSVAWLFDFVMGNWVFDSESTMLSVVKSMDAVTYLQYAMSTVFVFTGYLIFKRNHMLFSLFSVVAVFLIGLNLLNNFLLDALCDHNHSGGYLRGSDIRGYKQFQHICDGLIAEFPQIAIPVMFIFVAGMICFAYLRFEEKQLTA